MILKRQVVLTIGVACVAVLLMHHRKHTSGTFEDGEDLSLLQTFRQVSHARARVASAGHEEAKAGHHGAASWQVLANATTTKASAADSLKALQQLQQCRYAYEPVSQQAREEMLRVVGALPPRQHCRPVEGVKLVSRAATGPALIPTTDRAEKSANQLAALVPIAYFVIFGYICLSMLARVCFWAPRPSEPRESQGKRVYRPEAEAWKQGLISWLSISWASEWVARWGGDSCSTIKASELNDLGDPEDEPSAGYKRLLVLWDEELRQRGMKDASLMRVLLKFVGWRKIVCLSLWTAGYEAAEFLGPPLAMQWVISYIDWLYTVRVQGMEVPQYELVFPSVLVIMTFTGVPLMMACCNTVSGFLSQRMALQICGALSSLAVRKAQCLPLSDGVKSADKEVAVRDRGKDSSSSDSDDEILRAPLEGEEVDTMQEATTDENGNWKAPTDFNLVQVVSTDINMNLLMLPITGLRVLMIVPVTFVIFVLLWRQVRNTMFLTFGASMVVAYMILRTAIFEVGYLMAFLQFVGQRLQFLETTLFGIRVVKACGWEGIISRRVQSIRASELEMLEQYFWKMGDLHNWFHAIPKVMMFTSIFGYCLFYPGRVHSLSIFTMLPLLFTAQAAIMNVFNSLPVVVNARPAVLRCEKYIKQAEAPCGRPLAEQHPAWLRLWPPPGQEALKAAGEAGGSALRVKGSFSWVEGGKPALKHFSLDLPTGKSLAVIGQTGCGKTTFLQTVMRELYPVGDACLEVPGAISYSSQEPYICEGTLKENVLYGEALNQERFNSAIYSACLLPDLEVLPGGEEALIGSRGISLSGGQKARVSMARAAYNSSNGGLVLIDDPFGAVDSRTAKHLLDNLIHGACLEGRTKVVVTQPDPERITGFDQVMLMSKGQIVVRGTPAEVMATTEYQGLLNSHQRDSLNSAAEHGHRADNADSHSSELSPSRRRAPETYQLREEEFQGRVDWKSLSYFFSTGRWTHFFGCLSVYLLMQVVVLMMNVVLQHWSTNNLLRAAGVKDEVPRPIDYMWAFCFWWALAHILYCVCWRIGVSFTMKMSKEYYELMVAKLLHAPVDRFFDRTPVGRIMNRLSSDLQQLDTNTYNQVTMLLGLGMGHLVPIAYIHILMPLYFTVLTIPCYYLIYILARRYWRTMVPMRYLTHVSKSAVDDLLTEVSHSNVSVRAMQKQDFRLAVFQSLLCDMMKADVTTVLVLQRWFVNRLFLLLGFITTVLVLMAVWIPAAISFGGVGISLANIFQVISSMESYLTVAAGAQFQFISMNRLFEYTKLVQERPNEMPSDGKYKHVSVKVARKLLGSLRSRDEQGEFQIVRSDKGGREEVVLRLAPGCQDFQAPNGQTLACLASACPELWDTAPWHRLVAVNGIRGDGLAMATALCDQSEEEEEVRLEVHSGWLINGAEVVIEDLRAGYGDIPRDVLRDINVVVEPRSKVGIVGTTGCGKSTLLLTLLRILEPRDGRILINGVDTQHIGLETLRESVGLVPQDPVLLQSSVRENLDPFQMYSDEELWKGLEMVQLADVVRDMEHGLRTPVASDGSNLSYGQRQLFCLARTVIRQPTLILLDEATSALDPHTQELVQTTIESSFPKSTIIVIAHRLETILSFDMIIAMENGSIAEKGAVKDLEQVKGGLFARMLAAKRTW